MVTAAGAAAMLAGTARAYGQDKTDAPAEKTPPNPFGGALKVEKMEEDLMVVFGAGGNIAVYNRPAGTLVVDSGVAQRAGDVFKTVSSLVRKPVEDPNEVGGKLTLFNTHWHFDHTGANELFGKAGYLIASSAKCAAREGEKITLEDLGMTFEPLPPIARPHMTFGVAGGAIRMPDDVEITVFEPAHTDGDATLTYTKYNIFQTGDMFFNGMFPVIDRSTGGSLDGMIAATTRMLTMVNDDTRIIPGHGPLGRKPDLQSQLDLLKLTRERLAPLGEKKMSMEEVLKAAPLANLDDKWGRGFLRSPIYTRMAYGQWVGR
jgi:glyoxylase-like metal-dependent hydrolase (beta-lactamase superfamily II)